MLTGQLYFGEAASTFGLALALHRFAAREIGPGTGIVTEAAMQAWHVNTKRSRWVVAAGALQVREQRSASHFQPLARHGNMQQIREVACIVAAASHPKCYRIPIAPDRDDRERLRAAQTLRAADSARVRRGLGGFTSFLRR